MWIKSWMCNRQQRVVLDGSASADSPVLSGVPQGTVLGPLMFLLYVNDIGAKVSPQTSIKLFADDCLLYRTINSVEDERQLQQDLDTMIEWSNTWLMRFNAAKCHLIKITRQRKYLSTKYNINGSKLQEVSHLPLLIVELSSDLTWKTHICNITSKANRILNLLRRHLCGCYQDVKERAFTSRVQPLLYYSSFVWDLYHKYDSLLLEKFQRKGARFVTGIYSYTESITSMLDDIHWLPLQHRRKVKRLVTFYKATNNLSPVNIPDYVATSCNRTRTHDLAYIQLHMISSLFKIFTRETF